MNNPVHFLQKNYRNRDPRQKCESENKTLSEQLKQGDIRLRDSVRTMEAENSASKIANRELQSWG